MLAEAEVDGEKLTDEEILFFCFLLILAGNETTRNATSGGLLALLEHPEQRDRLLGRPSLCCRRPSRRSCAGPRP